MSNTSHNLGYDTGIIDANILATTTIDFTENIDKDEDNSEDNIESNNKKNSDVDKSDTTADTKLIIKEDSIDSTKSISFNTLLLGETTVGKTSIAKRYIEGSFNSSTLTTVGFDVKQKLIKYKDKEVLMKIYDTAGQERYKSIVNQQYKQADVIILVFDIGNKKSFDLCEKWINDIKEKCKEDIKVVLVGNKLDLPKRVVKENEGNDIALLNQIKYFEVSAKEGRGIDELFNYIISNYIEDIEIFTKSVSSTSEPFNIKINNKRARARKKCCGKKN